MLTVSRQIEAPLLAWMVEGGISGIWLEQVLDTLTEEERRIVQEFYINGKNEREACAALGLPKTTFRRREQRLREKLGILLKNFL